MNFDPEKLVETLLLMQQHKGVEFQEYPVGQRRPDPYADDPDNYVWLCGRMDVVSACRLIGIIEFLATVLAFILLIIFYCVFYSDTYAYQLVVGSGALSVGIICCIFAVGILILFFGALKAENPAILLVHLAAQIFTLIAMGFAAIVGIVLLIGWSEVEFGPEVYLRPSKEGRVQDQYAAEKTGSIVGGIIVALCAIGFPLQCYFIMIVLKVFRLFTQRNTAAVDGNGTGRQMTTVY